MFQSLIGIIDDFNKQIDPISSPLDRFQSLIGIIDDFNIIRYHSSVQGIGGFQSLIGIIDDFNKSWVENAAEALVSIPHRDYR